MMNNEQLIELFQSVFLAELKHWNPTIDGSEILCEEPDLGVGIRCSIKAFGKKVENYFSVVYEDGSLCAEMGDNGDTILVNKELLLECMLFAAMHDGIQAA